MQRAPDLIYYEDGWGGLRERFKNAVEGRVRDNLANNRAYVCNEMESLGIRSPQVCVALPQEQGDRGLREMQIAADRVAKAQEGMEKTRHIPVGTKNEVFDTGPDGSLGDTRWIVEARTRGTLPVLIVQGVLLTDLARAADVVLPGASFVEKEASYTNEQGRLQGTAQAILPPGDAMEDWQVLVNLATALGVTFDYSSAAHVRADIAARFGGVTELEGITSLAFARPVSAKHWLQASNPSERWKWDFMYQDLPPIKGELDPSALPLPPGAIPLKRV